MGIPSRSIVIEATATTNLEPAPITPGWILDGTPKARNKTLAESRDRASSVVVWECTAGRFNWHYSDDETVVVISGEVFITTKEGEEMRLGPGDMGFFPSGSSCTWRVKDHVKKVAVLRKETPPLLNIAVRAWRKLFRAIGLRDQSALMRFARS